MPGQDSSLQTLILDRIYQLVAFTITIVGAFYGWKEHNKRMIGEAKEKSVGETAITELGKRVAELEKLQRQGAVNQEQLNKLLHRLEEDYDFLRERLFDLASSRPRKQKP